MKRKISFILLSLLFLTASCGEDSEDVVFYPLKVVFRQKFDKAKKGKPLSNVLKTVLNYTKIKDESSVCFGKYYVPEITFNRIDLDKEEAIDFPITEMVFNTRTLVTKEELDNNYDVNLIETPALLTLETNTNTDTTSEEGDSIFVLNIYDIDNAREIQKQIIQKLCENGSGSFTVVVNSNIKKLTPEPDDTTITTTIITQEETGSCNTSTVPDGLDLKQDLLVIINASLSNNDRIKKGREVWEKYFDKNAYVASYLDTTDNNPEVWNPGEAKQYLTGRLAMLNSITDLSIFRIERSKINNKITGIKIIECHNASQLVQ